MKRILLTIGLTALSLSAQNISINEAQSFQARDAGKGDEDYQKGLSAIDDHDWEGAIRAFNQSASQKKSSAPAALYWKAYALNKASRRAEALETIAELKRDYKGSRWVNDAQVLEVEMHSKSAAPLNPTLESDDELKMVALNSLMQDDSERALPILEKVLTGNNSEKVKERALFVLVQNGSPKSAKLLGDIARGSQFPNLQLKAIEYMGMMGDDESRKELPRVYSASNNVEVKRAILKSYMMSGSHDLLLNAAKTEQNPELRQEAIQQLAMSGGSEELWQLYSAESSADNKRAILKSMFMTGSSDRLADLARNEKDPSLRAEAIQSLGLMGDEGRPDVLISIFKSDSNRQVKDAVLQALFIQDNGKALVDLARAERNPEVKREIVGKMALMDTKETKDYMMEILK